MKKGRARSGADPSETHFFTAWRMGKHWASSKPFATQRANQIIHTLSEFCHWLGPNQLICNKSSCGIKLLFFFLNKKNATNIISAVKWKGWLHPQQQRSQLCGRERPFLPLNAANGTHPRKEEWTRNNQKPWDGLRSEFESKVQKCHVRWAFNVF